MNAHDHNTETDLDALFDAENYLYFNQDLFLTDEQTRVELRFLREKFGVDMATSLLDLACGHGRHANALARESLQIVGLDTNSKFLELARKQSASETIRNVTFLHKDIRQLEYFAEFERAMMLNTVFGLFTDDENCDLLRRINAALKPSGLLCFDVINRDTILVDFHPDHIFEKEGNFLLDRCSFDERTGRVTNKRIYLKDGRMTHAHFSIRLYNYTEIADLLTGTRFEIVDAFADWHGNPMDYRSKKIVIIARKKSGTE
ncbi:MAG TPA: class I SAM-dependent methyltransferase [Verrucomicrobiae bacterium]|nr:class I SAM-dependent methyltransferase [Verrucomicrobiae bacterium]